MSDIMCIDVSKHQGKINWQKVRESGVEIAILRAGYGRHVSQKDVMFEENYRGCKENGIKVGVYWYSYALSKDEVLLEAKACLEVIKGKQFEYPIYFDLEEAKQFKLGKQACSELIDTFCSELEKHGYFVGLYMSRFYLENYVTPDVRNKYTLWIAEYNSRCYYLGDFGMWQNSCTGRVPGIQTNVDTNEVYFDYTPVIKSKGLNGFNIQTPTEKPTDTPAQPDTPVTKTIDDLANEVLQGKWGNGADRKQRLTEAGYVYADVQKRVNELVANKTPAIDYNKIAREIIRGDWGNGEERRTRLTMAGIDYNKAQAIVNNMLK